MGGWTLLRQKRFERSIVWREIGGFQHTAVDTGENRPGKYKASPIGVPDENLDANRVHANFAGESSSILLEVATYVLRALETHPFFAVQANPPFNPDAPKLRFGGPSATIWRS